MENFGPAFNKKLMPQTGSGNTALGADFSRITDIRGSYDADVALGGIVIAVRDFRKHCFLVVSDPTGTIQCVLSKDPETVVPTAGSHVKVYGKVIEQEQAPGGSEIFINEISILSSPKDHLPVTLNMPPVEALDLQICHRAVGLRNPWTAAIFRVQAEVGRAFREAMTDLGFIEIHSPKFVAGGTEGGAEVFTVDYFDRKVSLAQSPQLYKQITAGALGGVFEIGPIFRAENSNTNRHLTEFTGLDFEVPMIRDEHDLMDVEEHFMRRLFASVSQRRADDLERLDVQLPEIGAIPRITWCRANDLINKWQTQSDNRNFDLAVSEAVKREFGTTFVFVYGYPTSDRPFYTMPYPDAPEYTRSFDLIYDGLEISSGAQRIHDFKTLSESMQGRGLDPRAYPGYFEAFEAGMPPHGGGGMGLERITQKILGLHNIREATLFPRDVKTVVP